MDTQNIFAHRLREAASRQHLTQAEISRAVHVTRATVCQWFKGRAVASGQNLVRLADALRAREEWLTGQDDGPPERRINGIAAPGGVHVLTPSQLVTNGVLIAMHEKLVRLTEAWLALPENEREEFSRQITEAAMRHRARNGENSSSDSGQHENSGARSGNGAKRRPTKKRGG